MEATLQELKFDRVVIDDGELKGLDRDGWEILDVEIQRELLAVGKVRFFRDDSEVPFYRALL